MLRRFLPARMWWIWLLLVAMLGLVFYLVLNRGTNRSITGQQLKRQEVLAKAESSNISSFFQAFGESVAVLAKLSSVDRGDAATTREDMDSFVEQWRNSELILGVLLTDRNGIVRFNSNVLGIHDTGASLADRDYFVWAKNHAKEGDYFIGTPVVSRVGASKGRMIVPVASPAYQKGVFAGVMATSAVLKPLTENYLGLLKISDATDVYLIGSAGNLLYSSLASNEVGMNVFDPQARTFLGSQNLSDKLKDALGTVKEGAFATPYLNSKSRETETRLVAYSPVPLGNQNWLLVMASPIQEVTDLSTPIYIRQTAILLLVAFTLLLFGIIVGREGTAKKLGS